MQWCTPFRTLSLPTIDVHNDVASLIMPVLTKERSHSTEAAFAVSVNVCVWVCVIVRLHETSALARGSMSG